MKSRNSQEVSFRQLSIADFFRLHKMYDCLNDESRQFFNLYWLGLKSRSIKWYFAQIPLFFSTVKSIRSIAKVIFPRVVFLSKIAVNEGRVACFGFVIIRKGYISSGFTGEFGVATDEKYRGMGLATKMVNELIEFSRDEGLREIYLTVRTDNNKAFSIYQKLGFKKTGLLKNEVEWKNNKYDMFKMVLKV